MPQNQKISDLNLDTAVTLADYVPVVASGGTVTKKASLASILALGGGTGGGGISTPVFANTFTVNLPVNDTGIPNGTVISAGDSISTFLQNAFRKASPAVYVPAAAELSANLMPAQEEVGTPKALSFTEVFIQHNAGAETSRVVNRGTTALTPDPITGIYSDGITLTTTPVSYQAVISYAQGPVLLDSLGNPDPSGQIPAGSVASNVLTYVGSYKIFFGATDTAINSGNLRSVLTGQFLQPGSTIDFPTGSTYHNFYVAVPPGHTLSSWVDFTSSSASLLGSATSSTVNIADGGTGTLNYTLYKVTVGSPYGGGGDLFKFNIS